MSGTAATVRRLVPTEIDVAAALHALCFEDAWDRAVLHGLLTAPGGFGCLAIDASSGVPGGFVLGRIAAKECEILTLGVAPAARRNGWGVALVRDLMSEARNRGADSVLLEVAEENIAAIKLYAACGFAVVGNRRAYYKRAGGAVDAQIMRLALGDIRAASQDIHNQSID